MIFGLMTTRRASRLIQAVAEAASRREAEKDAEIVRLRTELEAERAFARRIDLPPPAVTARQVMEVLQENPRALRHILSLP